MPETERNGFGDFLRSRRGRLTPAEVGLSGARRRRIPGLRREEVAELAGIGVDWYIRLEQGRMVTPSSTTVDALARALRLDSGEHAHLRALAMAASRPAFVRETVSEALQEIVQSLSQPAFIKGRRWDVLAWNAGAAELFTDFGALPEPERNILHFIFAHPAARRLFGAGWAEEARQVLAQFRLSHDLWAGDPAFVELVERVRAASPEFDGWWRDHDVRKRTAGRRTLYDLAGQAGAYAYATLQAGDDPALKLVIYAPVARDGGASLTSV